MTAPELVWLDATDTRTYHRLRQDTAAIPAKTGCGKKTGTGVQAMRDGAVWIGAKACGDCYGDGAE